MKKILNSTLKLFIFQVLLGTATLTNTANPRKRQAEDGQQELIVDIHDEDKNQFLQQNTGNGKRPWVARVRRTNLSL